MRRRGFTKVWGLGDIFLGRWPKRQNLANFQGLGLLCFLAKGWESATICANLWKCARLVPLLGLAKGDRPKVTEPNLRFPAVFCKNLLFSAKICGFLRFPAPSKCLDFQEKKIWGSLRKSALWSLSVTLVNYFRPLKRAQTLGLSPWAGNFRGCGWGSEIGGDFAPYERCTRRIHFRRRWGGGSYVSSSAGKPTSSGSASQLSRSSVYSSPGKPLGVSVLKVKCHREEKGVHDHHRKKIFWGTFLASKKNFPSRWWIQSPYENQENHIYHRNVSSVAPIFFAKEKFCTGAGRCMLSFSQCHNPGPLSGTE